MKSYVFPALAALAALALIATASVTQAGPAPTEAAPTEAAPTEAASNETAQAPSEAAAPQEIQAELMTIQQRLNDAEQKALADAELQASQAKLQADVDAAMKQADPAFDTKVARLTELQGEFQQAQMTGDEAALQALASEGMQVQQELAATQARVIESEPLSSQIEAFGESVREKMAEVDPQIDDLIKRADELVAKLQAQQGAPMMMPQ